MEKLFTEILNMSISVSYLIVAIIIVRLLLGKAPKNMRIFLWMLVGIRLVLPFSIESVFSLVPDTQVVSENIGDNDTPRITYRIQNRNINLVQTTNDNIAVPSQTTVDKTISIDSMLAVVWLVGLVLMIGYMVVSWLRIRVKVSDAVPYKSGKIYQSDRIDTPFLFGLIKPRIYVPFNISEDDLPYVILHEEAHLKRRDYLIKPIGFVILGVYWFNPLVWISYILLCKDIELACDEKVVKMTGMDIDFKKSYSQALLSCAVNRRVIAACPLAFGEVGVKTRVKNILNYKKPAFWIILAAIIACIAIPICFMTNRKDDTDKENETLTEEATEEDIPYEWVEIWAGAFCERDADLLASMANENAISDMENNINFEYVTLKSGETAATVGWSSPWPWHWSDSLDFSEYEIMSVENGQAKIRYFAVVSDPHVTVWIETLSYEYIDGNFTVTGEDIKLYDNISSSEEFYEAYPDGVFRDTMMDYAHNGMAEYLYDHATAKDNDIYNSLFSPDTAAVYLLNINSATVNTDFKVADDVYSDYDNYIVTIDFGNNDTVEVYMTWYLYLYDEVIWLPYNPSLILNNYIHGGSGYTGQLGEAGLFYDKDNIPEDTKEYVLYETTVDLTNDGIDDLIQLVGVANMYDVAKSSELNFSKTKYFLDDYVLYCYVKVFKGISKASYEEEALFVSRDFSSSHVSNGYICYTYVDGNAYLITGDFWQGQGAASYNYDVLRLDDEYINMLDSDEEALIVESYRVEFTISDEADALARNPLKRADVMPEFEQRIGKWSENATIIVAFDIAEEEGSFSSIEKECPASTYFDLIWNREY